MSDRIHNGWIAGGGGGRLVRDNRHMRTAALVWNGQHIVQDVGSIVGSKEIMHNG